MRGNRAGEISVRLGLAARTIRELGVPNAARSIPADLVERVTRLLEGAVRQYRKSMDSSLSKRRDAWESAFVGIFKLLASRRLREQHDIDMLHTALAEDQKTTMLLSYRGRLTAVRSVISLSWDQNLSRRLYEWSNEFESRWLERNERHLSGVAPDSVQVYPDTDPLADCIPRYARAKDTRTARRIEPFRRRIKAESGKEVQTIDLVVHMKYSGYTMLQRVSREATNVSEAAIEAVERMLRCPSADEFWRIVDENRNSKAD
jgi:hypothetical protein